MKAVRFGQFGDGDVPGCCLAALFTGLEFALQRVDLLLQSGFAL